MELGNFLWGNSRGAYPLPREDYQAAFAEFLDKAGFDNYGIAMVDHLKPFCKIEKGKYYTAEPTESDLISMIEQEGAFLREDDDVEFVEDEQEYRGKIYLYKDREYLITPVYTDEFEAKKIEYDDMVGNWLDSLPEDAFDKDFQCIRPYPDEFALKMPVFDEKTCVTKKAYLLTECEDTAEYYENSVFIVRPYYWGDCDEIAQKPNFIYKPGNFEISWYKYPLRDAYSNAIIGLDKFTEILDECLAHLSKIKENRELVEEYPFLSYENDDQHEFIELKYSIPVGWWKRFDVALCKDLKSVLIANDVDPKDCHILEAKEKYGTLRLYLTNVPAEWNDHEHAWDAISSHTCVQCGAYPVPIFDDGWISPWCEDCFRKHRADYHKAGDEEDINRYLAEKEPFVPEDKLELHVISSDGRHDREIDMRPYYKKIGFRR